MAGKSNKGRSKRGQQNNANFSEQQVVASEQVVASDTAPNNEANGVSDVAESTTEAEAAKQGDLHLYPVPVTTQLGQKFELQLNPGDSVMEVRQFLLEARETCYFTCYDLLLHKKDGSIYQLEDFHEISEVADITTGDCSLEMVPALYDDRSSRAHVRRTRELLSLSTTHTSLSMSLAVQYNEKAKNTARSSGVSVESDVLELDGLGFMEEVTASLSNLLSSSSNDITCVQSIVFSSFNPPPRHRRLVGDLIYLDVKTLEGHNFCITGTTKLFYVNSSTGNTLDPRPSKASSEATTLVGLLQKISYKFKKAFCEILDRKTSAHPFENVQSVLPPNSWLGLYPIPDHKRDAARAEDAFTLSYGSELVGMQRDWNEELQSCREFPHTTPQERIFRDRALYKVTSDFVDAAVSGAIGVISRCIPPINATDPECFHMYVHNNIFFSFAVDADLEQLVKRRASCVSLKNVNTHNLKNSSEKSPGGISNGEKCDGSSTVECNGVMDMASDVSAETQPPDSEQATYASANNDLKGTKAYQEADVPGLYNLAMAIIDYRGHRVIAQSVLPGILQGDKSDSLLYGSVDCGKKICWNENFHSKVQDAAKRLHLKEHTVFDGSGNVLKLAAPVECKGIVGSDDRHYLLDLIRVTPRDANYIGTGSRFCILRSELITSFCQVEVAERLKCRAKSGGEVNVAATDSLKTDSQDVPDVDKQIRIGANAAEASDSQAAEASDSQDKTNDGKPKAVQESGSVSSESTEPSEEILFNPNVFTEFKLAGSQEEIAADEEYVRKVSLYLTDAVLPKFIQDICTLEVSPMDGQTLTEALHAHGINVRYIGKVAEKTKHLPHLFDLCSNEIVVRSAKHILKDFLRDTEDHDLGPAITHFFNCFFGSCQAIVEVANSTNSSTQKKDQPFGRSSRGQARWKGRASAIKHQSYMNESSESLWFDIKEFAKLKYQFELPEDARARVKKVSVIRNLCLKVGITIAARMYDLDAAAPFQSSDILDLQPVVKHSVPTCSEAKDLVETGKIQLAEGMLSEAYALFSEAFSILQQVTGPLHREVANCCRYLAMVLYHAGDMGGAIAQQHKELIINERCLGLDHPDTAHSYGNMALFYHGLKQTELALKHMSRALLLLGLSSGPDHPDVASTYINVAMMYQDLGKMDTALRYLQEALKMNERLLGEEHIQTGICYHALAIAFSCMGAFKLSHQHEKKTYDIFVKQLGEEDSRTRESQTWMKTFKAREHQNNIQKQKGQGVSTQEALDILKARPDLLHAFQAVGASGSSNINKSLNASVVGEGLPRGRGIDERAAKATAVVRKKAAAKGVLRRAPQSVDPIKNVIENINSSMRTPVGLGQGLASLDEKKQKTKPKSAA